MRDRNLVSQYLYDPSERKLAERGARCLVRELKKQGLAARVTFPPSGGFKLFAVSSRDHARINRAEQQLERRCRL